MISFLFKKKRKLLPWPPVAKVGFHPSVMAKAQGRATGGLGEAFWKKKTTGVNGGGRCRTTLN